MTIKYQSLLGNKQGAQKLHVHLTEIPDTRAHATYQHKHKAEEAVYILEGTAEYVFAGMTVLAVPGDLVFFPPDVLHAKVTYLSPTMKYLLIRNIEVQDEGCCCGEDKK